MLRAVGHLLWKTIVLLLHTLVELGQNATINCSLNIESAYWYIQHHPQPPLAILRSFTSSSLVAFYYNNNYRQKYSIETGNRLLIQNVTVDDCGVFYCAKEENDSLLFSNGTRLMTTEVYVDYPNQTNQTSSYPNQTSSYPNQTSSYPNQTSIYPKQNCLLSIYSVLTVILMVMMILGENSPSKLTPRHQVDQKGWLPVCLILLIGPQFSLQIKIFPEEWANGNFSLLLTDLKESDRESYSCFIPKKSILCLVQLSGNQQPNPAPEVKTTTNSSRVSIRGQNISPFLFFNLRLVFLL
uniref:Immunoglobulin domain-containing protein n=1 Tax=Hucho hucho TaxID=62062 RepID=A0A4W5RBY4_9TELE